MSTIYRLKLERAYLEEALRKRRKKGEPVPLSGLKKWFFRDILQSSFPGDATIDGRLKKRREALEKHGYFKEGEITAKGLNKLIGHIVNTVKKEDGWKN